MKFRSALKLPKEHGAWAMLYVPFALGVAVAGRLTWSVLLLLLSTTALFISRESLLVWRRARARGREAGDAGKPLLTYLALAAVFGLPLIIAFKLFWLVPMGLIGAALLIFNSQQATRLEERTIAGESLAICGLTLTAPAAYYVASGRWDGTALWLWLRGLRAGVDPNLLEPVQTEDASQSHAGGNSGDRLLAGFSDLRDTRLSGGLKATAIWRGHRDVRQLLV